MKALIMIVALVMASVMTSVAASAKDVSKVSVDTQTVNSLVVAIQRDVNMPCKTEAGCVDEIRVAIKGHIMAAAGHSEDKFWALFTEVRKVFYDRESSLAPEIKNISTADLTDEDFDKVLAYQNASLARASLDELFVVHVAQEVLGG